MSQQASTTSREEQRAQTRSELLTAARTVFARNGYHGTSVDMVAEKAGYTKGAVYSNFDSKEDLFLALLEEQVESSLDSLQSVMEESAPEDRPSAFGERRNAIANWNPEWFLLEAEFELYAARNPAVREVVAIRQRRTREVVTAALQRHVDELGLEPRFDPAELATLVVAAGDGLSLLALNNPDVDTGRMMQMLLEIMAGGATT